MRRYLILVAALLFIASAAEALCDCGSTNQGAPCTGTFATDHVITWTWTPSSECGQFVDGSYWVKTDGDGDVDITNITESSSAPIIQIGAMANAMVVDSQGFAPILDPGPKKRYDPALDIRPGIVGGTPYAATATSTTKTSIITGTVVDNGGGNCIRDNETPCVDSERVLTVLDAVPPDAGFTVFRPGMGGNVKRLWRTTNVDTSLLPNIPIIGTDDKQTPFATITERWRVPGWDVCFLGNNCRLLLPGGTFDDGWGATYGGEMAAKYFQDLLSVFGDEPLGTATRAAGTSRINAIYALISRGIDIHTFYFDMGKKWPAGAGQAVGRKSPLVFFAAIYNDQALRDSVAAIVDQTSTTFPHFDEDGHFWRGPNGVVAGDMGLGAGAYTGNTDECTPDKYWNGLGNYICVQGDTGTPSGTRDCGDPTKQIDGSHRPGQEYIGCCYGGNAISFAMAQWLMPKMRVVNNNPDILDFADRYGSNPNWPADGNALTKPDKCAPVQCSGSTPTGQGVTWGRPNGGSGDTCIEHHQDPMTHGRRLGFHGGGDVNQMASLTARYWDDLRPCADDCSCAGMTGLCTEGTAGFTLSLGVSPTTREVNQTGATATSSPAGGTPPYTLTYDLDNDGAFDDGSGASIAVPAFSTPGAKTLRVHGVDSWTGGGGTPSITSVFSGASPCPAPGTTASASSISFTVPDPMPASGTTECGDNGPQTVTINFGSAKTYGCYADGYHLWVSDPSSVVVSSTNATKYMLDPTPNAPTASGGNPPWQTGSGAQTITTGSTPKSLTIAYVATDDADLGVPAGRCDSAHDHEDLMRFAYTFTMVNAPPSGNGANAIRPPWSLTTKTTPAVSELDFNNLFPTFDADDAGMPTINAVDGLRRCVVEGYQTTPKQQTTNVPLMNSDTYHAANRHKYIECMVNMAFSQGAGAMTLDQRKQAAIGLVTQGVAIRNLMKNGTNFVYILNAGFGGRGIDELLAFTAAVWPAYNTEFKARYTTRLSNVSARPAGKELLIDDGVWTHANGNYYFGQDNPPGGYKPTCALTSPNVSTTCKDSDGNPDDIDDPNGPSIAGTGGGYLVQNASHWISTTAVAYAYPKMYQAIAANGSGTKFFSIAERFANYGGVDNSGASLYADGAEMLNDPAEEGKSLQLWTTIKDCSRTTTGSTVGIKVSNYTNNCPGSATISDAGSGGASTQDASATLTVVPDCGDGVIQAPELCEPTNVGATCAQAGYTGSGAPGCTATCDAYTVGTCTAAACGDGVCDTTSECTSGGSACVTTSCFQDCANWTSQIAVNTPVEGWLFVQELEPTVINQINLRGVPNGEMAIATEPLTSAISGFSYLECDYPAGDNCVPLASEAPFDTGIQNSPIYAPFGDNGTSVSNLFPRVPPPAPGTKIWKIQACTDNWTTTSACGAGTKSTVRSFTVQISRPRMLVTPNAPTPAPVEVASPIVPFDPTAPVSCWARYARWQTSPPVGGALGYRWLIDGTALSADTTTPSIAIRCPLATDSLGPISVQALGLESESEVSSASSPNSCGEPERDVAACGPVLGAPGRPQIRATP